MKIGKNYKIESDSLNVTLYKKESIKKGGTRRRAIAYFSNPKNALEYLVNLEVMDTGLKDLKTVVKKQEELYDLINSLKGLSELLQSRAGAVKG